MPNILEFCRVIRRALEPGLPGFASGAPVTAGACLHASFLLSDSLARFTGCSTAIRGGDGKKDGGALGRDGTWYGHYWVEATRADGQCFVADITADQFGHAPVVVMPLEEAVIRYRPGHQPTVDEAVSALAGEIRAAGRGRAGAQAWGAEEGADVDSAATASLVTGARTMIALSVRQPWAWLIANRYKPIENRTWATKYRGPFLIHAGQAFDLDAYRRLPKLFPEIELPSIEAFERGGIVGRAVLVDCLPPGSELRLTPQQRRWYQGENGFLIANAQPVAFMPLKGKLGFFKVRD